MIFGRKKKKEVAAGDEKKPSPKKNKNLASRIISLFKKDGEGEAFYEDLEDLLIESDMGGTVTMEISEELRASVRKNKISSQNEIVAELRRLIADSVTEEYFEPEKDRLNLFLILGVNESWKNHFHCQDGPPLQGKGHRGYCPFRSGYLPGRRNRPAQDTGRACGLSRRGPAAGFRSGGRYLRYHRFPQKATGKN